VAHFTNLKYFIRITNYRLPLSIDFCTAVSNIESIMLNNIAHQKPSIFIPSINLAANNITIAFIAKRNKPRVTTVTGSVSTTSIGFTTASNAASTTANIKAVKILSIRTPDNIFESTKATIAEMSILIMKFILKNG
jgi:hypothetical protein